MRAAALAVLLVSTPLAALAAGPGTPVPQLHVLVPDAQGEVAEAQTIITRELKKELTPAVAKVDGQQVLTDAAAKLGLKGAELNSPKGMAAVGREVGADYVVLVNVIRRGWLYTARVIVIESATGLQQMDFRSDFYKVKEESGDRGKRIGQRTLQKLETIAAAAAKAAAPKETLTKSSTAAVATTNTTETSAFGGGDSSFGGGDSPFGSDPFGEAPASSEFDGFEAEGGWLWSVRGWIGTTYQAFLHPDLDDSKDRNFNKLGIRFTLTGKLGSQFRLRALALLEGDTLNQRLHRALIEEGFVEWAGPIAELRVGWDSLTWGAASLLNIIDVINTRDLTEGVIDAPKIGQPMVALRFPYENHSLTLLYLTPFILSQFPRLDSSFAPFPVPQLPPGVPLPRLGDTVVYGGKYKEWNPQAGARLALSWPGVDIRASYFFGYARLPTIEPQTFAVVHPLMHHVSTDGQLLFGQTTLKWELASIWQLETESIRDSGLVGPMGPIGPIAIPGQRFAWVVGVEHTLEDFAGGTRLTPVVEFVADSDSSWFTDKPRPDFFTAFTANHLVYGFDWSFENAVGSALKFADLMDLTNPTDHALLLEYSERWFEHFTFDVGARWVFAEDGHPAAGLRPLSGVYTRLKLNY